MPIDTTIHTIDRQSEAYPPQLETILNPPQVIYAKGNLDLLYRQGISIVGTRKASSNGLKITERIASFAVGINSVVVSGLALGIDAAAHKGCLDAGGQTIAVLAGGLHKASPYQNAGLANQILEQNGLWVSEQPTGTNPQRHFFVARNRIQVGLSQCSVVVESEPKSGTTSHAKFCVEANHPLFAVMPADGNPLKLHYSGPEKLVADMNAIPLRSREDYEKIIEVMSRG